MFGTPLGPQGPPFRLPAEHFAAALLFLGAGVVGTTWAAPDLAAGAYPAGRVLAVTHLFTLGWITTSIMGVLYQFLPVALGEPIRSVRLAHATFAIHVTGVLAFVVGLTTDHLAWILLGAALVGIALLGFGGHLAATLARVSRRDLTWWCLAGATGFLFVTVATGLAHAGNLRWGYLGEGRFVGLGVHVHVAVFGWVLLLLVGVATKLFPMFLPSDDAGEGWGRVAAVGLAGGAGTLALLHHGPALLSRWLPAALLGVGGVGIVAQVTRWYGRRQRTALDPGMRLAAGATAVLAAGVALAGVGLIGGAPRMPTAWVGAFVLAASLFIAAFYFKIIPFLVWYHRFSPLAGRTAVPRATELFSHRWAGAAGLLLCVGAVLLVGSVVAGSEGGVRMGGGLLVAGATVEAMVMVGLARTRPER